MDQFNFIKVNGKECCSTKAFTIMSYPKRCASSQQVTGDQEEKTEMKEKTEKNGEKRVPVLTISLRPGEKPVKSNVFF